MTTTKKLQEVILVEHFKASLPLTIFDVADWAREFEEFDQKSQLPWAAPVNLQIANSFVPIAIEMGNELPRALLRNERTYFSVQLQADRFAFGWSRGSPIGEEVQYPGFDELLKQFEAHVVRFKKWCTERFGISPQPRVVELGYNNATELGKEGGPQKISDVFKWVTPSRHVNSFHVAWHELIQKDRLDGARVAAVVAVGHAPPVLRALIHNFTGHAPVDESTTNETFKTLALLHDKIIQMHDAAISDEIR